MHFWYKIFTYLFYPVAPIYLYFRKLKNKENKSSIQEKLAKINIKRKDGYLIWFHVASVGEAMSILPLVEKYLYEKKITNILITSITLSSGTILQNRFDKHSKVIHQFLPLDIPNLTKKFLEYWKPNLSIFIDSEIWPNLILQISKKNIPLVLLNARITEKTFNRWKILNKFSKKIFSKFDLCIVANNDSKKFLDVLGAKNIKNYGNLKFSNIGSEVNTKLDLSFLNSIKDKKIWCASSTHYPEEKFCAEAHLEIKKKYNNLLTIIIPRHVNRAAQIKKELSNLKLKVALFTELKYFNSDTDILLIDTYGDTLKFYNILKYVFLGKSLIKSLAEDSGQNPIEAGKLGCKIFHGPNVSNFFEIYDYFKSLGRTKLVNNSAELSLSLVEEFEQNVNEQISVRIVRRSTMSGIS